MALYNNLTITAAGAALIADCLAKGEKLTITAVSIGDAALTDGASEAAQTALIHEVKRADVESAKSEAGVLTVTARFSTDTLTESVYQRELGIYSNDTLLAYGNTGENYYDYLPAPGTNTAIIKAITASVHIGGLEVKYISTSGEIVNVTADEKNAWNEHIADGDIHATIEEKEEWNYTTEHADIVYNIHLMFPEGQAGGGSGVWALGYATNKLYAWLVDNGKTDRIKWGLKIITKHENNLSDVCEYVWIGSEINQFCANSGLAASEYSTYWVANIHKDNLASYAKAYLAGTSTALDGSDEAIAPVGFSSEKKMFVPAASETKAGGVLLATGLDDTRATAVPTAAQLHTTSLANAYKRWADTTLDASTITQDMLDAIIVGRQAFQSCGLSASNLLPTLEGGAYSDTRVRIRCAINTNSMFYGNADFNQPLSIECSTSARYMLSGCTSFNSYVSAPTVIDAQSMLYGCTSFNKEVTDGDHIVGSGAAVTLDCAQNCTYMLSECTSLNSPVSLPSATLCGHLLDGCSAFNAALRLPQAVVCNRLLGECSAYDQPLSLPNAVTCDWMLIYCTSFNSALELPRAETCIMMLKGCTAFNQPLDLPKAKVCTSMLNGCTSFNQPVKVPSATTCTAMLAGCSAMSVDNIVATLESLPTYTSGTHEIGLPLTCAAGSTSSALTDEQKAIATSKGWRISYSS